MNEYEALIRKRQESFARQREKSRNAFLGDKHSVAGAMTDTINKASERYRNHDQQQDHVFSGKAVGQREARNTLRHAGEELLPEEPLSEAFADRQRQIVDGEEALQKKRLSYPKKRLK